MDSDPRMLTVSPRLRIPLAEFEFSFVRSSGPGGQNVNKVNSKAVLRWQALASPSLPEDVRTRLAARYRARLTGSGELLVTSQRYRDQARNANDCLDKVRELLAAVAMAPKKRRPTRPSRAAKERRLDSKRVAGRKKELRRRPPAHD
jgi:ribosome-associated protein